MAWALPPCNGQTLVEGFTYHFRVYVSGRKADDIPTDPFPTVHLGPKQYFVMGDNGSASHDSRVFGPVPRGAIYARAILIVWPFHRFGVPN